MVNNADASTLRHNRQQHHPGAVETPLDAPLKEHPEQMEKLLSEIPLGRIGKPEEIAALAVYLASDASACVTGRTFFIDGGMIRMQEACEASSVRETSLWGYI
jgi:enoyl-[acyl-carrier-protein] reductase (NADH)